MRALLVIAFVALLSACESPEATRTRGGGPGGDIGNRPESTVRMHEGSRPYYHTPRLVPTEPPSLDPARHARGVGPP
ncbi:hypothetical protein JI739_09690 [Ramlibacter sp. AW1]|uniref:Lipoprotein n=1 Tax=Ramlibacter aurantiacus TaxID=2801330 RepID=A0A936ZU20_9BURK|nr:hypothetical protein [Ramlibacter aurantiacus]MBL0420614.1 hypothetical protein [Ramlibacter aurantiacus]